MNVHSSAEGCRTAVTYIRYIDFVAVSVRRKSTTIRFYSHQDSKDEIHIQWEIIKGSWQDRKRLLVTHSNCVLVIKGRHILLRPSWGGGNPISRWKLHPWVWVSCVDIVFVTIVLRKSTKKILTYLSVPFSTQIIHFISFSIKFSFLIFFRLNIHIKKFHFFLKFPRIEFTTCTKLNFKWMKLNYLISSDWAQNFRKISSQCHPLRLLL